MLSQIYRNELHNNGQLHVQQTFPSCENVTLFIFTICLIFNEIKFVYKLHKL